MSTPTSDRTPVSEPVTTPANPDPTVNALAPLPLGDTERSDARSFILDSNVTYESDTPQIVTVRIERNGRARIYELQGPELGGSRSIPLSAEAVRRLIEVYAPAIQAMQAARQREIEERDRAIIDWR